MHSGFLDTSSKIVPDCDRPDAYVDSLLAAANVPFQGRKLSSSWGKDLPLSALPWIFTNRKRQDRFDALHAMRRRPFYLPESSENADASENCVHKNKERLEMLWKVSASHGVSWDDLDRFYLEFHKNSKDARKWIKDLAGEKMEVVSAFTEDRRKLERMRIHDKVNRGEVEQFPYEFVKGEERDEHEIELAVTRNFKRMVKKKRRKICADYKKQYNFGKLTQRLRDFMLHKMAEREAYERSRGLRRCVLKR